MSIQNLKLSPRLLTELYKNDLVLLDRKEGFSTTNITNTTIKSLGENKKRITILVQYPNVAFLPDDQLHFLSNMLLACKLSLGDVAIINLAGQTALTYNQIISHFKSEVLLLFAISPSKIELPILFPHFQIQQYNNCTYLFSPNLEELQAEKNLKMNLWTCLKTIFKL